MAEDVPTVLVTGASGFVATHIVQQLQQAGEYKVRGTVRSTKNEAKVAPIKNLCPGAKYPVELVEADLTEEAPWVDAVKGCTYVLHTASPFPSETPKTEDEVVRPAIDGTLHVLKACRAVGGVKRVVLTSSVAAIAGDMTSTGNFSEKDWADDSNATLQPYMKSKTMAERAAWKFVEELPDDEKFELVVINPSYVVGPVLCGSFSTSQEVPKRLLERSMPMVPKINFNMIDVRDVARAHINALTIPEAAGKRVITSNGGMWMADFAKVLDAEFKPQGYNVPTREAPNLLIKLNGLFDKTIRFIVPGLGKRFDLDNDRMKTVLGIDPIDPKQSVIDMAYSMIESGKIKKTSGYTGPPSSN